MAEKEWNLEEEITGMDAEDAVLEAVRAENPCLRWLDHVLAAVCDAVEDASEEGLLTPEEEGSILEGLDQIDLGMAGIVERLATEAGLLPVPNK